MHSPRQIVSLSAFKSTCNGQSRTSKDNDEESDHILSQTSLKKD